MSKLEQALRDPAQVFKTPQDVVDSSEFNKAEKIEILHSWGYDLLEVMVAEDEANMLATTADKNLFDAVIRALHKLDAALPLEKLKISRHGQV